MGGGNSSPRGSEALAQAAQRLWVPYGPSQAGFAHDAKAPVLLQEVSQTAGTILL